MKVTMIPIVTGALDKIPKCFVNGQKKLDDNRTNGEHRNNRIITIGQNTKKSRGDLKRLAVTQTLVENHHLILIWKNSQRSNNNNKNSNNKNKQQK